MIPYSLTESQYLYGVDLIDYRLKPYESVLLSKVSLAKGLLSRLVRDDNMADPTRVNKVSDAVKFNQALLRELGYSDKDIHTKVTNSDV